MACRRPKCFGASACSRSIHPFDGTHTHRPGLGEARTDAQDTTCRTSPAPNQHPHQPQSRGAFNAARTQQGLPMRARPHLVQASVATQTALVGKTTSHTPHHRCRPIPASLTTLGFHVASTCWLGSPSFFCDASRQCQPGGAILDIRFGRGRGLARALPARFCCRCFFFSPSFEINPRFRTPSLDRVVICMLGRACT